MSVRKNVPSKIETEWRGETLLVDIRPNEVYVKGFVTNKMNGDYETQEIPIKLQKNCRAYLRGFSEVRNNTRPHTPIRFQDYIHTN